MATIRQVPSAYPTIQAAHDAATEGDTIVIAPGTYAPLIMNRRVHLKGDTTDIVAAPVRIVTSNGSVYPILMQNMPANLTGDLWMEGITFDGASSGQMYAYSWSSGLHWHINRCSIPANHYLGYFGGVRKVWLTISNLTATAAYGGAILYLSQRTDHRINILAARLGSAPVWPGGGDPATWAEYLADYKTVDTPGYGAAYGTWYAEQWMGRQYALGGTVRPRGADAASQWQALIYRERIGGGMESTAWAQATPDPITGRVRVGYLPTDRRYYVAMIGPAGYPPSLQGPYDPAQEP
jgi:hypothetical protein